MTTAIEPLWKRLSKEALETLQEATGVLVVAAHGIENPVTRWDFCDAIWHFMSGLGVQEPHPFGQNNERPASMDNRPLYQRLDDEDENVSRTIRRVLFGLTLVMAGVTAENEQNGDELHEAYTKLNRALGLPTTEERQANPDAYPNVRSRSDSDLLTAIFGLHYAVVDEEPETDGK